MEPSTIVMLAGGIVVLHIIEDIIIIAVGVQIYRMLKNDRKYWDNQVDMYLKTGLVPAA